MINPNNYTKNNNVSKIIGIQFSILSPEEILNGSVAEITSKETYIGNKPVVGGIFDPRMGVLDSGLICPTDGLNNIYTPGYFGHIVLAKPVFYIQYLNTILKILRCVCFKCNKLLINKEKHKHILYYQNEAKWKYVFSLASKMKRCGEDNEDGCGCKQPSKIRREGLATIYAEWVKEKSNKDTDYDFGDDEKDQMVVDADTENIVIKITPEMVIKMFKRISDDDVSFMGFSPLWSRPENMVCQVMAVPPPAVRPSVKHDSHQRSEDDLSHILINIIKTNNTLYEKIQNNASANVIDVWTTVLQYYVATQIDNKIPGVAAVAQRSGRPLKSIKDRLNGKNGRMRGNLMAKRVDFSGRSVITADPNISIRELGVPMKIAKNITKPVKVNASNRNFLLKLIENGPDIHPGAKILEKRNGESITLRYVDRKTIVLEDGDIVHRHMMNGDPVLFNRQPTLHRMSMQCHIARILSHGDTFRMNVANTKGYNADFDGDEMNLHMPQDLESDAELHHLAAVPYNIVSPGNNTPIIGIFQDSLLGSFLMTRKNVNFSKMEAMNLLMMVKTVNEFKLNRDNYRISNFDVLSQIMPPLSLKIKNKLYNDDNKENNTVEIVNGEYRSGQIDKGILGSGSKGILHRVCNDFGNFACSNFIDNLQSVITSYMIKTGFSVGVSDLISDKITIEKITNVISDKKNQVNDIIEQLQFGVFINETGKPNNVEFETRVNNILNQATSEAGNIGLKNLDKNNRFVMMVNAGSKGSELNIAQMIACLGQQNVDGQRIPNGFEHRTLPHYTKYDDTPNARGFVESSYINGLKPQELFFHAMGGRVGLIDTAVKSVVWSTPIMIIENSIPKYVKIGEWIDKKLKSNKNIVKHFDAKNMELLETETDDIFIPTTNEYGVVSWGKISAITKHDPGNELYEFKTASGRSVIVVNSKSMIVWKEEKQQFIETDSPNIQIGDFLPTTLELCEPPEHTRLNTIHYEDLNFRLELTHDNGVFLGLFMANGFLALKGKKHIFIETNDNNNIKDFINNWYDKMGITYKNNEMLYSVIALNDLLYDFLKRLVFSENETSIKTLPTEFLLSPREFIIGFINGYTSGCGNIEKNSMEEHFILFSCLSKKFAETFTMIFSRLGIFTHLKQDKPYLYRVIIKKDWLSLFQDKIKLLDEAKRVMLMCVLLDTKKYKNSGKKTETRKEQKENVILDEITQITIIRNPEVSERYKKVYDLTIPSTLNFGLANGLQVRDTSTTGYIQRRLIKSMEDLMVGYNGNVLTNKDYIVQFKYGYDGIDPVKVETQEVKLVEMSIQDVYSHFNITEDTYTSKVVRSIFTKETLTRMKTQTEEFNKKIHKYINEMLENRNKIVRNVFKNKDDKNVRCPVSFSHIIANVMGQQNITPSSGDKTSPMVVDITPLEALTMIEESYEYLEKLYYFSPTDLFKCLYYFNLSPKDLIFTKRFNKIALTLLLEKIVLDYKRSIVAPGEMVGMIAAQSIGEPTTQLTLNTFHNAGISSKSNVTRGVPRIEEILTVSENPKNPSLTIYLHPEDETNKETARSLMYMIEHTKLQDVIKDVEICFDPDDMNTLIEEDRDLLEQYHQFEKIVNDCLEQGNTDCVEKSNSNMIDTDDQKSKWILRLKVDEEKLLEKNITMDDIHFALRNSYSQTISCIYSDYNASNLIFRIRLMNMKIPKKKVLNGLDQTDQIHILKNFQEQLLSVVLKGVNYIDKVILRKIKDNVREVSGVFKKQEIWVFDTVGTNLMEVLSLNYIDKTRTFSNDIVETLNVLGIEAARQTILNELSEVLEFDGAYINFHHLSLLVDRMTYRHKIISVFRHGINNDDIGPIAKASFEETNEMFIKASKHAELDIMKGVSACIMCGQEGYYGTSSFQLVLDMDKMLNLEETARYTEEKNEEDIDRLLNTSDKIEDICNPSIIKIDNNIINIGNNNINTGRPSDDYELF